MILSPFSLFIHYFPPKLGRFFCLFFLASPLRRRRDSISATHNTISRGFPADLIDLEGVELRTQTGPGSLKGHSHPALPASPVRAGGKEEKMEP